MGPFIAADDPAYTVGHVSTDRLKRMLSLSILLPSAMLRCRNRLYAGPSA